ncbi:hypothetical protein Leryth_013401, partial [Lithospermum erythrorhizon]
MVIVIRLVVLAFFLTVQILILCSAISYGCGFICEIWFAFSWILDQFPKWFLVVRLA